MQYYGSGERLSGGTEECVMVGLVSVAREKCYGRLFDCGGLRGRGVGTAEALKVSRRVGGRHGRSLAGYR